MGQKQRNTGTLAKDPKPADGDQPERPLRRRFKPVLLIAAAGLLAAGLGALWQAPYLPRLMVEGFPAPILPAGGSFAVLKGAEPQSVGPSADPAPITALGAWSGDLFAASGGRALLALRDGRLVLEHYAPAFDARTRFNSYSLVKSLIGTLILRAVTEKRIASLDDPVGRYLPEAGDAAFRAVPLAAFLDMRSGVAFAGLRSATVPVSGAYEFLTMRRNPFGPMARLHMRGFQAVQSGLRIDPAKADLFDYQNINSSVLAAVLEAVYDTRLNELVERTIWMPAGAGDAVWRRHAPEGGVTAYCCIYAPARDWIAVAAFVMRNGEPDAPFLRPDLHARFFGKNIDPAERQSGTYRQHLYHNVLDRTGEALQGPFSYFYGANGQTVYMLPEKDLVVVRFGERPALLHSTLYATWRLIEGDSAYRPPPVAGNSGS
ncbi:MAG: serine hydrolase domain-containing protein [Pseudomonadota bacterium]